MVFPGLCTSDPLRSPRSTFRRYLSHCCLLTSILCVSSRHRRAIESFPIQLLFAAFIPAHCPVSLITLQPCTRRKTGWRERHLVLRRYAMPLEATTIPCSVSCAAVCTTSPEFHLRTREAVPVRQEQGRKRSERGPQGQHHRDFLHLFIR